MKYKVVLFIGFLFIIVVITFAPTEKQNFKTLNLVDTALAIYLDEERTNYIPLKDTGYIFDSNKSGCTSDVILDWDSDTWSPIVQVSNHESFRVSCNLYFKNIIGETFIFDYTGDSQAFVVPYNGVYKIEAWGASGVNHESSSNYPGGRGGYGSYVSGEIYLLKKKQLYVYVGEVGISAGVSRPYGKLSFNGASGGSYTCYDFNGDAQNYYGGSATDIRLISGN